MIERWTDPADRLLARSVFETDDLETTRGMIADWVAGQGFGRARVTAIELSVGAAVTVTRADHSMIFVKVWPGTADVRSLAAQMELQAAMAARGFPAPAVLTTLSTLGPGWAVGMAYDRAGVPTDVRVPGVRRAMAGGLARLVAEARACRGVDDLPRWPLPPEGALWPKPHNTLFDFGATARGAGWIDEVARSALRAMRAAESHVVVGHSDWSAKNMRMGSGGIAVLYDWDSVFLDREAFVVGSAAAHFPVTWELDVPETPSAREVVAFVREYEEARGAQFTSSELEAEAQEIARLRDNILVLPDDVLLAGYCD